MFAKYAINAANDSYCIRHSPIPLFSDLSEDGTRYVFSDFKYSILDFCDVCGSEEGKEMNEISKRNVLEKNVPSLLLSWRRLFRHSNSRSRQWQLQGRESQTPRISSKHSAQHTDPFSFFFISFFPFSIAEKRYKLPPSGPKGGNENPSRSYTDSHCTDSRSRISEKNPRLRRLKRKGRGNDKEGYYSTMLHGAVSIRKSRFVSFISCFPPTIPRRNRVLIR